MLSCLPLPVQEKQEEIDEVKLLNTSQINSLPVSADQVHKVTRANPILSRVLEFTMTGWPDEPVYEEIKSYYLKRFEIMTEGCLLWGIQVIIPTVLREQILRELHVSHPGVVQTKSLTIPHVWWSGLEKDITGVISECSTC